MSCEQAFEVNDAVRQNEESAQTAIDAISPDTNHRTPLTVVDTPWYGHEAVSMKKGKSLPRALTQANAITMTFPGPVSFQKATQMIESVTSIPVAITNNIYASTLGTIAEREFLPSGGQEVSGGRVVWSGSLQNILNQLSNTYGSEWAYTDGVIRFTSEQTKTFMLNALANEITLTGNASSTSGGATSSGVPEIEMDGTATLQIWGEIQETVNNIIGEQGNASFSPSTGAITITARTDVLRRVENYLRYQNKMRLRRIAVSVKVLSVETADSQSFGLDVGGLITEALGGDYAIGGSRASNGGVDVNIIKSPVLSDSGIISSGTADPSAIIGSVQDALLASLNMSKAVDRASIIHSGSIVTLSDQPAPLQISKQIAYLERVSSSGGDAAAVSLEPGTIDVGLFMSVLPRIVEDNRILMRLSIAITDADPNFRTFGSDEVQIELPEIDTTGFLQNAVVGDGETLVLAGFEKRNNSLSDQKTPLGWWLGGTHSSNKGRQLLVLLINSQILPEQPLTIIGE